MATIADNLQAIRRRAQGVTLLAVSKSQPADAIREAAAAGQKAFGENYVQEAVGKMDALPPLEWHLIGPLQSNKTRVAAERFDWVQTVASERIAKRLSDQRPAGLAPLNVLIQANVSSEATKSGVALHEVETLARAIARMPRLRLRGLMAIPEPAADREGQRRPHAALRELLRVLQREGLALDTLSMGMTADLEAAILEGATIVRVGTAIFGTR
jgi:pyridoxal phosphate enzyme (YggS family)